jgi:2,4-diketo-3-deoxy-L-fuconate hydrolase
MTGTPEGVAPVMPGDTMHAWFEGIGEMSVAVR